MQNTPDINDLLLLRNHRRECMENSIIELLSCNNLTGPNFEETPQRVAKYYDALLNMPFPKLTTFPLEAKPSMILIKDHVAWSLCPHHLLPVKYTFKIGYIPTKWVFGLSKPARIADFLCSKLLLQEEIAPALIKIMDEKLQTQGSACVIKGEHLCMQMRGVESQCVSAVSSAVSGVFLNEVATRAEFMAL